MPPSTPSAPQEILIYPDTDLGCAAGGRRVLNAATGISATLLTGRMSFRKRHSMIEAEELAMLFGDILEKLQV